MLEKLFSNLVEKQENMRNHVIKSEEKKQDTFKNWPLIKNPQFLSNLSETW